MRAVFLLYFPIFFAFMSYDLWLWHSGATRPEGERVAAVHSHGRARYLRPEQARLRDGLESAVLVMVPVLFLTALWTVAGDVLRRRR